ncbi:MAG: hypothetical protein JST28_10250 [Acidobacteria bacterium]|nr:hypothetical protein [Acidobacteriota bacterium]
MRARLFLLRLGIGLLLSAFLGMLLDHSGSGASLWLLLPSFLLVGIAADRNVWRRSESVLAPDAIWFAPNS